MSVDGICLIGKMLWVGQRTLTIGGRITVQLVSSLTRLDLTKKENMLLFVLSEAVQSELDKLETSFKGESSLIGGFESGYGYYYRR